MKRHHFKILTRVIILFLLMVPAASHGKFNWINPPNGVILCGQDTPSGGSGPEGSGEEESEHLKSELEALIQELKRLEKEVRSKFRDEIVPMIRKEIEKLRKRLEEFQFKGSQPEENDPVKT